MAHEELKFKVEFDFNQDQYQPIYASLDYGTFYMIYADFVSDYEQVSPIGVKQYYYTCNFKLQNFRGDITIGFNNHVVEIDPAKEPDVDAYLKFQIRPFKVNEELKNVVILSTIPLKKGMVVQTKVTRKSPPRTLYDPFQPQNSAYLNPYRFERDGEDFDEISKRDFG